MSLSEKAAEAESRGFNPGSRICAVKRLQIHLDKSSTKELEALNRMLEDRTLWSHRLLADVLAEEGYAFVTARVLEHHRNKDCACR